MKTMCSFMRPCPPSGSATRSSPGAPDGDARIRRVQAVDHVLVLRLDRGPPNLLGPRQLVIVGVQFLVEEGEAPDARRGREALVHARYGLADQGGDLGLARKILERGEG